MRGPNAPEAERALLGAMFLDAPRIAEVRGIVAVEDFAGAANQIIARAMFDLGASGGAVSPNAVLARIRADVHARAITPQVTGGWEGLVLDYARSVSSSAHAAHHAKTIAETAGLRRLCRTLAEALDDAENIPTGIGGGFSDFLDGLEGQIQKIGACRVANMAVGDIRSMDTFVASLMNGEEDNPIKTHMIDLDRLLQGVRPGEVLVAAARPGKGKTAWAAQVALNIAKHGGQVLFASLEEPINQLRTRVLANEAKINSTRIRTKSYAPEELEKVREATVRMRQSDGNLTFINPYASTVAEILAFARGMQRRSGLDLLVVDYLQLMRTLPRMKTRYEEVTEISRSIKAMALDMNIPIIAISQLSRAGDDGRPRLSHLRESGQIEQDADAVIMLWSDDDYGPLCCAVEKNRHGPCGELKLTFDRACQRLTNYCPQGSEEFHI